MLSEQEADGFMSLCRKIYDVMIEDVGTEESATVIMEMEMDGGPALQVHFTTIPEGFEYGLQETQPTLPRGEEEDVE